MRWLRRSSWRKLGADQDWTARATTTSSCPATSNSRKGRRIENPWLDCSNQGLRSYSKLTTRSAIRAGSLPPTAGKGGIHALQGVHSCRHQLVASISRSLGDPPTWQTNRWPIRQTPASRRLRGGRSRARWSQLSQVGGVVRESNP
jgi:hypothetical protein